MAFTTEGHWLLWRQGCTFRQILDRSVPSKRKSFQTDPKAVLQK